jgi:hypothetical protein
LYVCAYQYVGLDHGDGVILQVVVDLHNPVSLLLGRRVGYDLGEVGVKDEDLLVEPDVVGNARVRRGGGQRGSRECLDQFC